MQGLRVWRLSTLRYAEAAFSGDGPSIYGGRWNPVGVPVVYSSLSLSLAVLEVLVHMDPEGAPRDYVWVSAALGIEEAQAERVEVASLPSNWRETKNAVLQRIGAEWARSMRSLALLVPSVIVEGEWNALINPLHPDATKIVKTAPKPFYFDERLFKVRD